MISSIHSPLTGKFSLSPTIVVFITIITIAKSNGEVFMDKMTISPEIRNSVIRFFLTLFCGMLIARGKLTPDQATHLIDATIDALPKIMAVVSALVPIWTLVSGIISHTQNNVLRRVANMPEVEKVLVKAEAEPTNTPAVVLAKDTTVPKVQFTQPPIIGGARNPSDHAS